jgi:hypothetical protein
MTKLGHFLEARLDRVRPEALLRVGAEPRGQGARPQGTAPVPRVREGGAGGRFDQLAGAKRLTAGRDRSISLAIEVQTDRPDNTGATP